MKKLFTLLGIKTRDDFAAFIKQFFKFGVVGLSNTAVFLGSYYALLYLGMFYVLANIMGFALSVLNAFFWSRRFVFTESDKSPGRQLLKVYSSYGFTFLLSLGTLMIMVEVLGVSEVIAPLINMCYTVPLNFILNKFWAFR
ncbi:MAG: GtrA family protein [Defluviitaleaceae bacterium]|nr:GtrA family protein [Defluviitaleaceae bacterium]